MSVTILYGDPHRTLLPHALDMRQQINREGLVELDRARQRLRPALAAVLVQADAPELALVH